MHPREIGLETYAKRIVAILLAAIVPDFLVRLREGFTLVLEVKGRAGVDTSAKHQAAQRWCAAVNNWGKLGRWEFMVCWEPQELGGILRQANLPAEF